MKKHQNIIYSFCSLLALFILIYLAFSHYSLNDLPWLFYNSDNGIPYLYQDLIERGGHLNQWIFAAVNNFFPDIVLFFSLEFLVHNIRTSMLLLGVVQLAAFYWLLVAIGNQISKAKNSICLYRLSALSAILLLAAGCFVHKEIMEAALVCWLHFGVALMCLVSMLLVLRIYTAQTNFYYILLFVICALTTFSDLLFITQFSFPAILTLGLVWFLYEDQYRSAHLKTIFVILAGTLTGYVIYKLGAFGLIHIHYEKHILKRHGWHDVIAAVFKLQETLQLFYRSNAIMMCLWLAYFFLSLGYLIKLLQNKILPRTENVKMVFVMLLLLVSIAASVLVFIFLDNDLMVDQYYGMRHYQPMILFPVFLGIPLCLARWTNLDSVIQKNYLYFLAALVVAALIFTEKGSVKKLWDFYPESVKCLDNYARQYNLQNGIASYWDAKSYTFLSKNHVTIAAVTPKLKPYAAINTLHDYENRDFTFLIMPEQDALSPSYPAGVFAEFYLSPAQIAAKLGKPHKILVCPSALNDGKEIIYIYKRGIPLKS